MSAILVKVATFVGALTTGSADGVVLHEGFLVSDGSGGHEYFRSVTGGTTEAFNVTK
tara:strand:- start:338 stop:508 length:171 start_codon:yes stop_codon:yes gene_type:complete